MSRIRLALCLFSFSSLPMSASVTRYADFPLGEPGSLGANNQPQDVSGNARHFTAHVNGATAVVATSGVAAPSSTNYLDISAATDQWWSGGPNLTGITDNFAFGVYARAATANQGDIFCTAASGNSVYKLSMGATGWCASAHNIAYIGNQGVAFTPNTWVHLALIRAGGQTTFYVNGVAQGSSYAAAPAVGAMSLGGFTGSIFDGQIDEARVVTFSVGESSVNILAALQSPAAPLTTPPVVTSEPQDLTAYAGDAVTMVAPAVGGMPMTWRWYAGSSLISESTTSASLNLTNLALSDAGNYHAEISNNYGVVSSRTMKLTVLPALITLPPSTTPSAAQQAMINRKYGMFCHFGINTFHDQQWTDGSISPSTYTPTAVDVDQWVRTAYLSGMTYVLFISKHHDGFCMWPSDYTTYDVDSSPNKTDVMKLAAAACAKYGIKLAIYYSLWDRNWGNGVMRTDANSLTAAQSAEYVTYMKNQLTELFTNYGPVCELWFDGSWVGPASVWNLPEVYDHVKKLQPNCQIASNITIGSVPANQNAGDAIQYFPSDFRLHDPMLPKFPDPKTFSHNGSTYYLPFEATITLSSQNFWFYDTRETSSKSLGTLENWWNTTTAQNNLLVLNAAPDRNGVLLPWDMTTLAQLANRLGLEPGGVFPVNLATAGVVTASSVFNNDSATYGPTLATDENPDSRWSAASGATTGWLEVDLGAPTQLSRVIVNEYLTRIQSFNLQSWDGSAWQTITTGTTIGESKRIDFPAVTTRKLRLNILSASDSPSLWNFKVQAGGDPAPPPDHDSVWKSSSGGVWQVPSLWESETIASGVDRTARFDTLDLTSPATVILQSAMPVGHLRFGDTTPTHDWTIEGINHHPLTLTTTTGSPTIHVANRSATISAIIAGSNGFTKSGGGSLILSADNGYSGVTAVNNGALMVNGSTTAASTVTVASGAVLGGSGTIHGAVTLATGATLAPGYAGMAALTLDAALSLPAGSTTVMNIAKSGSTRSNDHLSGMAGLTYGGTLTVAASGDALGSGDSFTLFSLQSGGYAGTFATMNLPSLAPGLKWDTSALATTGTIVVADVGAAKPVFTQPAGYYYGAQSIGLSCSTPGAVIHFTTDGTMPTADSPTYASAIAIPSNSTVVINALAVAPGLADSAVASATYTTGTSSLTIQAWYRLGETSSLGTNNRPQDSSGNARHFANNQNVPTASSDDVGGPLGRSAVTSSESLLCGSGQVNGFWNNGYALPADNAGMEIWAKASTGVTDGWMIASGSSSSNLVMGVSGGKYRASATGGTTWFDDNATPVSTTTWTHLALVRAGGITTFYVNGVAHGTSAAVVTAGNACHLAVTSGGNSGFKGLLDEARMFTFSSGAFQVNDLWFRVNHAPVFDLNAQQITATQDLLLTGSVVATDSDAGEVLNYAKISGPIWFNVSAAGEFSGTPSAAHVGPNALVIRATDGMGASATMQLTVTVVPPNADGNANGMLDSWERTMFGNANAGVNLPEADADGDGLSNLLEYAFNTHPLQATKNPMVYQVVEAAGESYLRLTMPKNPAATNLGYVVEMTDDLTADTWVAAPMVVESESSTERTIRITQAISAAPRNFVRVRFSSNP